jgi:hypothetical protein
VCTLFSGGSIERWEDEHFRTCFADILKGEWRKHDPYDLEGRINARSSMYNRPNQASVFRTYQGWLAMRYSRYISICIKNAYCSPVRVALIRAQFVFSQMCCSLMRIRFFDHFSALRQCRSPTIHSRRRIGNMVHLRPGLPCFHPCFHI